MILCISDVLNEAALRELSAAIAEAPFKDGKLTAGWHARLVKNNQQLERKGAAADVEARIREALQANEVFRTAVLPREVRPMLISRYEAGMSYGTHVDDAVMGGKSKVRSDVSVTVFLSAPEDYEGGELVIEDSGGERAYKLPAGAAIAYPSTTLHRVEPVTAGRREVAVTWVQSLVRSAEQRDILFDLACARRAIFDRDSKSAEFDLLSKSYANLLRMWTET